MQRNHWLLVAGVGLLTLGLSYRHEHAAAEPLLQTPNPPEIADTAAILAKGPVAWHYGSFPVENFQGYTSPFGFRISPTGGFSQEFHTGLDFAAPTGSYIRSWWSGKVVEVSDNTACGTSARIQSGSWLHVYCHMQGYVGRDQNGPYLVDRGGGIWLRQGQEVNVGQRIGRVGMTGRTTGPHLHWTLKYQGKLVDPGAVLRRMQQAQASGRTLSLRP
jgi:murein DD-endopeptidase MepM/ murein hydrolase activator NlpD